MHLQTNEQKVSADRRPSFVVDQRNMNLPLWNGLYPMWVPKQSGGSHNHGLTGVMLQTRRDSCPANLGFENSRFLQCSDKLNDNKLRNCYGSTNVVDCFVDVNHNIEMPLEPQHGEVKQSVADKSSMFPVCCKSDWIRNQEAMSHTIESRSQQFTCSNSMVPRREVMNASYVTVNSECYVSWANHSARNEQFKVANIKTINGNNETESAKVGFVGRDGQMNRDKSLMCYQSTPTCSVTTATTTSSYSQRHHKTFSDQTVISKGKSSTDSRCLSVDVNHINVNRNSSKLSLNNHSPTSAFKKPQLKPLKKDGNKNISKDVTLVVKHCKERIFGSSTVAIDNKIEQAMDLVKSHLMFAVREEVEVLKEQIRDLVERMSQLEYENGILRAAASAETLALLAQPRQPPPSSSS